MSRLNDLYARYLGPLIADLKSFGQSEEDARDIAQETMIATWKRLDHVTPGCEWIYLRTAARNHARKRFRRSNAPRRGGGLVTTLEEDHDARDDSPSAEARLIEKQEIERFRARFNAAMAELGSETQQCLVLKRRGRTSREIAEELGLTDQAVRTRMSRATALIRERVGAPPANVAWIDLLGEDDDHHD